MRHPARRDKGHHGPAYIVFFFLLLALLGAALTAHAAQDPDWRVYSGDAVVDTVDGSKDDLFAAGRWVLLHDSWELERTDPARGTMVTGWKPVKHPLVRLAAGPAQVRVAVALKEVSPNRTEVRVLGGIASKADLGSILPLARTAGRKECEGFVSEMKTRWLDQRTADGAGSGARLGTGEKR